MKYISYLLNSILFTVIALLLLFMAVVTCTIIFNVLAQILGGMGALFSLLFLGCAFSLYLASM